VGAAAAVGDAVAGGHRLQLVDQLDQGRAAHLPDPELGGEALQLDHHVLHRAGAKPAELAVAGVVRPVLRPGHDAVRVVDVDLLVDDVEDQFAAEGLPLHQGGAE
jgi:hypothetical protein